MSDCGCCNRWSQCFWARPWRRAVGFACRGRNSSREDAKENCCISTTSPNLQPQNATRRVRRQCPQRRHLCACRCTMSPKSHVNALTVREVGLIWLGQTGIRDNDSRCSARARCHSSETYSSTALVAVDRPRHDNYDTRRHATSPRATRGGSQMPVGEVVCAWRWW